MITLRFSKTLPVHQSPLKLRFGDDDDDNGGNPDIPPPRQPSIGIDLGASWVTAQKREQHISLTNQSSKIGRHITLSNNSLDKVGSQLGLMWHTPMAHQTNVEFEYARIQAEMKLTQLEWALAGRAETNVKVEWEYTAEHQQQTELSWKATQEIFAQHNKIEWIDGEQQQVLARLRYSYSVTTENDIAIAYGPHQPDWICSTRYRPPENGQVTLRFSEPFSTSQNPIKIRFTPSPNYCYYDDGGGLIDSNPVLPPIDFKLPIEPQIRRSYIMQPQIICTRVSDDSVIVLKSVSRQISRGQYAATYSVSFSSRIDAERAAGQLLKISINGYDFYMLCETPSKTEVFGRTTYSATGRSRIAELSAPYKKAVNFVNTQSRSFIGLMSDIVEYTGWTIDNQITDFNVPAYAFSYSDKTPAEALNMMAAAIGAMLDIDDENKVIKVIPQWPVSPWTMNEATPDVVLNNSVILEHSEQTQVNPSANAVFVRGEQVGVARKVKLTGSAGDEFANDVVDKLITEAQAARMRGTHELANAGNKIQSGIRTKIMNDLPPIRPGMLIGVSKDDALYRAACEAVSINATISSDAVVTVNQSITLLRNEA